MRLIADLDAAFQEFRALAGRLPDRALEQPLGGGWTAKEMLAHCAFWEECGTPVIRYMLRGEAIPDPWQFGSGPFVQAEHGGWPGADVHNAREAAWARDRTAADVLVRWDTAHAGLMDTLATVTDAEAAANPYYGENAGHLREHYDELRRLDT
jgi:hypothetical protein